MDLTRIEQLWRSGRAGEAEAACRARLGGDADDPAAALLGVILSEAGRHDEAVALLAGAAGWAGPGGDPGPACAWAAALGRAGRHAEAAGVLRAVVGRHGGDPRPWGNLGVALEHLGHLPEAVGAYDRAVALDPARPGGHVRRGNALRKLGHLDESADAYRRACELAPTDPDPWRGLVAAEADRCRPAAAVDGNRGPHAGRLHGLWDRRCSYGRAGLRASACFPVAP